jgi:hypothetical protein
VHRRYSGDFLESQTAYATLFFIGPPSSIFISGSPMCSALFLKQTFKNDNFLYLYHSMFRHY